MKSKISYVICSIFLVLALVISPIVRADSDFDTSYDSGGWDSDSSWSSSDNDWDWDSSSGGGGSISDEAGFVIFLIIIIFIIVVFAVGASTPEKTSSTQKRDYNTYKFNRMTQDQVDKIDSSLKVDKVLDKAFDIFKNIQIAWMNFDYKTLEKLQTDEIYNNQVMKLKSLEMKKQQNVMEDITVIDRSIQSISIQNGMETLVVALKVQMKDYIVDVKTDSIIRGDEGIIENTYELTFIRSVNGKINNCPNCGAKLTNASREKCEYCDSVIVRGTKEFVLSRKELKKQRNL